MQSAASRRAFSALASKIHPQLPLSPRESQQLLSLLTTSFRAHLDREHPVGRPEVSGNVPKTATSGRRSTASPAHPASSYSSAAQHMDSILSNPLFARKPRRRSSEAAAVDVLKDPLSWFLDEMASGAADLPKAAICLELLQNTSTPRRQSEDGRKPASAIAVWLQSSGLDASNEFLDMLVSSNTPRTSMRLLVPMLLAEDNQAPLWRWLTHLPERWTEKTGVNMTRISSFRTQLLKDMVASAQTSSLDSSITIFLRAYEMVRAGDYNMTHQMLQPAGAALVTRIITHPHAAKSPALYESFLRSTSGWLGEWSKAVQSMLLLHHPTQPTAQPGLSFIQDPQGAKLYVTSRKSRQQFLVQLCLGVARQLLEEEKFMDAQVAMDFTKEHFAEMVLSKKASVPRHTVNRMRAQKEAQREKANLDMLDRLLPT